ncbi:ribbon-helix-helix protein, CopG family [Cutibacterium granulosum]
MTADELAALDVIADRGQVTRAEAIRQVLAAYAA